MNFDYIPWRFVLDANTDGRVTISDLTSLLAQFYFLPGDSLAYSIMHHALGLAEFLELSSNTYRGLASGIVSFFGWLISLITALLITAKVDQSVETRRRALGYSDEER